jgi:hypothetical protein
MTSINKTRTSFLPDIQLALPNVQWYLCIEKSTMTSFQSHADRKPQIQTQKMKQPNLKKKINSLLNYQIMIKD